MFYTARSTRCITDDAIDQVTPWTKYLALPKYTAIKHREDSDAKGWRRQIIEEGERRGKSALAEQQRARGTKRKRDKAETGAEQGDTDAADKEEQQERAKKRKLEKHAWRYAPHPCKDEVSRVGRAALKGRGLN